MAKQFDNTIGRFAHTASASSVLIAAAALGVLLFLGLGLTLSARDWPIAAVFGASIVGLVLFAWIAYARASRHASESDGKPIEWDAALPEIQRQNLNIEVTALSRILEVESGAISDLQSAYIVAEDLALRQIQQEEQVPLMRHVSVGGVPFDALFTKNSVLNCAEVAFLVSPELRQERVDSMMRKIAMVKKAFAEAGSASSIRLTLILITQLTEEDLSALRSTLGTARFSETPVDIDIRLLDFEALQRLYVTD